MRPHKWRVRCSRGTTSARPSGRSAGARGNRSGGMRDEMSADAAAERQALHEARQERERQASVTSGRPAWEVRVELPSHDDVVRLAGHLAARGWRVRPHRRHLIVGADCEDDAKSLARELSGDGRADADTAFRVRRVDIYPSWTDGGPPLLAACLDPGRLRVLRPALRARGPGINMATRKKHTPEQVVRKLATADREPPPRQVHDLDRRRARLGFYRPGIRPQPALRATVSAQFQLSRPAN